MLKNKFSLLLLIIIILSFAVPFLAAGDFFRYRYIASSDFFPPLDETNIYFNDLFVYNPFGSGGTDTAYMIAKLSPEVFLYTLFGKIGLSVAITTLIYLSLIIVVSELSMYRFLVYVFSEKLGTKSDRRYYIAIIGSIFYAFTPHFYTNIPPGHFVQLTVYAFFPLLLFLFEKSLAKQIDIRSLFTIYFIIFLLCATAFGNVAFIYVLTLTFGIYSLLKLFVEKTPLLNIIKSLFVMGIAIISANIFWLASFVNSFGRLTNLSRNTLAALDNQVGQSVTKGTIQNIIFGRAEWQLYLLKTNLYINLPTLIVFIFVAVFFVLTILRYHRKKFIVILMAMAIFAIFISKGPREPFGNFFMWLYHNLFGFQVFRRPLSKYWGFFFLFYLTIAFIGLLMSSQKFTKAKYLAVIAIPLGLISLYLIGIFVRSSLYLTPFNIPDYYYDARNYLIKQQVKKVLILPGLHGLQPSYNESVNNLSATDFLYSIWLFPFDSPIDAGFATEYHRQIINPIIANIRNNESICDLTKKAGISHIMVRQDLFSGSVVEDQPQDLLKKLDTMPEISAKKEFSDKKFRGFTIYSLDSRCLANFIQASSNRQPPPRIEFQIVNPTKIKVEIKNIINITSLKYLNNYNPTWKMYLQPHSDGFFIAGQPKNVNTYPGTKVFFEGDELRYLFAEPLFDSAHHINDNWANEWEIDPGFVVKNFSAGYYHRNSDGSIDLQLVLFYKTQSLLYVGLFAFFLIVVSLGVVYIRFFKTRKFS